MKYNTSYLVTLLFACGFFSNISASQQQFSFSRFAKASLVAVFTVGAAQEDWPSDCCDAARNNLAFGAVCFARQEAATLSIIISDTPISGEDKGIILEAYSQPTHGHLEQAKACRANVAPLLIATTASTNSKKKNRS